jgi:hypothetical protein
MDAMLKKQLILLYFFFLASIVHTVAQPWTGKWITSNEPGVNNINTWIAFRKTFSLGQVPVSGPIRIAADSKYWLWINGKIVIQEGGLKRGPSRTGTYIDSINIAPYLINGQNTVAILLWHFGKSGYSHLNSGKSGLLVQSLSSLAAIASDQTWQAQILSAYQMAEEQPNVRLAESNIIYDARKDIGNWKTDFSIPFKQAIEIGNTGDAPWGELVTRPIPFFEFSNLKKYEDSTVTSGNGVNLFKMKLPLNIQMHPYFKINATGGERIKIYTDNNQLNAEAILQVEYIAKPGLQEFDCPLWLNGEQVFYEIPSGIKVEELSYKKSQYATEALGNFTSSDENLNTLWKKSLNTLTLSMRDNWMDCPDRERGGWTGDLVSLSLQSMYTLDESSKALSYKWYHEFTNWRTPVHDFYSIIPIGNSNIEIPDQTLLLISEYGIENYLLDAEDTTMVITLYPSLKLNFSFWQYNSDGLILPRQGGNRWNWGDWGDNVDQLGLYNMLFLNSLKTMKKLSIMVNDHAGTFFYEKTYQDLKNAIRKYLWRGGYFASSNHVNTPDERVQAFSIISGAAEKNDYVTMIEVFETVQNASPYMEQFVFEALCMIGKQETALMRFKHRYGSMIQSQTSSTVWEGWQMPKENKLPKTPNHGWSGAALYLFPKWIHGIRATAKGFSKMQIKPNYGKLNTSTTTVPTPEGLIKSSFSRKGKYISHTIQLPNNSKTDFILTADYEHISINGAIYKEKNKLTPLGKNSFQLSKDSSAYSITLNPGKWTIELTMNEGSYLQFSSSSIYLDGKSILLYPNPVVSRLTINGEFTAKIAKIYALDGKLMMEKIISTQNKFIDLTHILSGVYIIHLIDQISGKILSGKFLKL